METSSFFAFSCPEHQEALMTFNAIPLRGDVGEVIAATVDAVAPAQMTTSLACYVRNGSNITWQWGLNNDNSYYVLRGQWITTPYRASKNSSPTLTRRS